MSFVRRITSPDGEQNEKISMVSQNNDVERIKTAGEKIPVLFLVFNRLDVTMPAFECIRTYAPTRLYIAADGPRPHKEGDAEKCEQTRQWILSHVDWDCQIETLFRQDNWGCAKSNNDSITWFFAHETWGIIIEDDVLVSQEFFHACEELLPYYKDETCLAEISAFNAAAPYAQSSRFVCSQSLYCWGWASWRRAWKDMDFSMQAWPTYNKWKLIRKYGIFKGFFQWHYWRDVYHHLSTYDSWAMRWHFSILSKERFILVPQANLAKNIGNTIDGAHYRAGDVDPYAALQMGNLTWPLQLPIKWETDKTQNHLERKEFRCVRWIGLKKKLRRLFKS